MNTDYTKIMFTIQFSKFELETVVNVLEQHLFHCSPEERVVLNEFIQKIYESEMDHAK
jgi:hypothetical protein